VLNRQRRHSADLRDLALFLDRLAVHLEPPGDFSLVLVSDRVMERFNGRYRGKGGPTDVLSFEGEEGYLGDILISADTAYRQSEGSRTLTPGKNIKRLALHGLLHLMGYDHETDHGEMKALETRLRRRFEC
jgi:probable rRNA maturation factor